MTRAAGNANFRSRLLTKSQAAQYCGLSSHTFGGTCPVTPISLGHGARMQRYDVHEIDRWIDGFKVGDEAPKTKLEQILEKRRWQLSE